MTNFRWLWAVVMLALLVGSYLLRYLVPGFRRSRRWKFGVAMVISMVSTFFFGAATGSLWVGAIVAVITGIAGVLRYRAHPAHWPDDFVVGVGRHTLHL